MKPQDPSRGGINSRNLLICSAITLGFLAWCFAPNPTHNEKATTLPHPSRSRDRTPTTKKEHQANDRLSFLSIDHLAADNLQAAASKAQSFPDRSYRRACLSIIAHTWAEQDHHQALTWAESLDDERDRHHVLTEIANGASASDPHLALRIAAQLPDPSSREALIRTCLHQWAMKDPRAAAGWAKTAPTPSDAAATVATTWARQDPGAAITFAIEHIASEAAFAQMLPLLISEAAHSDLPMLREWLHSFDEGSLKDLARAELTRLERDLPPAPASLPGEGDEDRTPKRASAKPTNQTREKP